MQGSETASPNEEVRRHSLEAEDAAHSLASESAQPVTHLLLARPLVLFSDDCVVRGSVSPALPDVDAILHIAYGHGNMGLIRRVDPNAHQQLVKARYAIQGEHKLTLTSEKLVCDLLKPAIPSHELLEVLRATEEGRRLQKQRFLPWRAYSRTWTQSENPQDGALTQVIAYLKERETIYAVLKHHERAQRRSPERDALEKRLMPAIEAWRHLAPNLGQQAFLLTEEALYALAHFDVAWSKSGENKPKSRVIPFLEAKRRPMGHWLHEVACAYGQKSLAELHENLFRLNVKHKGRHISLDLLKKWSAARQLLVPSDAVPALLNTLKSPEQIASLEGRFLLARVLMFLLDIVRAGTIQEEPEWSSVQEQVRTRYEVIFDEQVTEAHRVTEESLNHTSETGSSKCQLSW